MFIKLKLLAMCAYLYILGLLSTLSRELLNKNVHRSLKSRLSLALSRITERLSKAFYRLEKKVIHLLLLVFGQ